MLVSAERHSARGGVAGLHGNARLTASHDHVCLPLLPVSIHTPDALLNFLRDPEQKEAKIAIQVFASVYAFLFRHW